jgi:hypothetical protein
MKKIRKIVLALPLITMALSSMAQGGVTRDQVKAELVEARRTGNLVSSGESGLKLNELNPKLYPAKSAVEVKTRDQRKADVAEATRTGTLSANDETGATLRELHPKDYPAQSVLPSKSREQVLAELAEARLLGNVWVGEESDWRTNGHLRQFWSANG